MTDWVLTGVTTESGTYDAKTCLLVSMHNPWRANLTSCVINSNNSCETRFLLVEASDDEDSCFDELEKVMLAKTSFRVRRQLARVRTHISYTWPRVANVEVTTTVYRPIPRPRRGCMRYAPPRHAYVQKSLPGGVYDCSYVAPGRRTSCIEYNLEKHQNKFGTPVPRRRASMEDEDETLVAKDKKGDHRAERMSNDSVINFV